MTLRRIVYVTGTRADYGLMRNVLKALAEAKDVDLSLCVTGMHLDDLYGNTLEEIKSDGHRICGVAPVDVSGNHNGTMSKAIGKAIIDFTDIFQMERPDIVLLLGDRGEMLAGAIAAVHLNIPVVHIHGGERSGTVDEMIRHAISKLSHYHFVATSASRGRLIKMGEQDESIFVVGAPGLDEISDFNPSGRADFYQRFGFVTTQKTVLLMYHPVVQEMANIKRQFLNTVEAALALDLQLICLEPNSDHGGHSIREVMDELKAHPRVRILKHLIRHEFLDCLAHVDVMLGNSSSGIIEAASFKLPVVNVGSRQNLRERSTNVIDVSTNTEDIISGLKTALQEHRADYVNCYGDGKTSNRCYQLLRSISLDAEILKKSNVY